KNIRALITGMIARSQPTSQKYAIVRMLYERQRCSFHRLWGDTSPINVDISVARGQQKEKG
ncbi:hypothetical protein, partial [Pseudomonas viridiflava]|uniref:hypothetical protein n=1 Tax=Pseudomonas viridiflava TaxID=33069 RepID=UPI001E563DB4